MFSKVVIFCIAFTAVLGSPQVNAGVNVEPRLQNVNGENLNHILPLGNYAYAYDITDAAVGSVNPTSEVENPGVAPGSIATARSPYGTAYSFGAPAYPSQAINAPMTYAGRAIVAPIIGLGVGLGRGLAVGLRRGADLLSERLNNVLI